MNKKSQIFFFIFIVAAVLTSCDSTVKDFVKGALPEQGVVSEPSLSIESGTMQLKVSPAKVNMTHPSGSILGNVSLTNRTYMAGPDMSVNLTLNRYPSNP